MLRVLLLAIAFFCLAAPRASADCAATCGDVCYAPDGSAFARVEVLALDAGYGYRVRVVERLGGSPTIDIVPGDERDHVYSQIPLVVGDAAFMTLFDYDGNGEPQVYNTLWPIRGEEVECDGGHPNVPLDQYVAMATSDDCAAIASDLEVTNTCNDTYTPDYCNAGASPRGLVFALVALVGACRRRRRA